MLFSLFGWELVWIRKFKRISIRNPDQTLSVTSHPRRAAFSTVSRGGLIGISFQPKVSRTPNPNNVQNDGDYSSPNKSVPLKDVPCEQTFLDLQNGAVMYRGQIRFFHLIRMKMDSLLSGVTAICPIIIDNDPLEQESTH